jgi:hypothetical protein
MVPSTICYLYHDPMNNLLKHQAKVICGQILLLMIVTLITLKKYILFLFFMCIQCHLFYYSCTFISQFKMQMVMEHKCILCHKFNDLQAGENNNLNEMLHQFSSCEFSFKLKLSTFLL